MYKLISLFLHPFSFLLVGILILFNTNTFLNFSFSTDLKFLVYAIVFINTMVLPVTFAWYLSNRGHIKSILFDDVSDRKIIYFISFIFYLATLFVLSGFDVPGAVYKYAFGATMTVGALFVLALVRKKLSAHLAALGGLVGALSMLSIRLHTDFMILIYALVILSGVVGVARIQVGAHREHEVYWGFLLGFFSQVLIFN